MISIFESQSKKCVGKTSLFISFDYNPKIVEIIKQADNYNYNKDTHIWELPLSKLSYLIDELTYVDDIKLNFLEDEVKDELQLTLNYKSKPFDYQEYGIKWLINHPNSLLLDTMGLGKTLEIIYTAEELKAQKGIEHCLIICGINSLKANWKSEIAKHSRLNSKVIGEKISSSGRVSYASVKERADELYNIIEEFFVIINIESLRDSTVVAAIQNSKNNFDMIVVDELHKLGSNTQSDQSKGFLKIKNVGKYHYGLTGTLLTTTPLNAYLPLKFIGQEKGTFTAFKQYYTVLGNEFGHYVIKGYKNIDVLKDIISDCSLRRTKDILNLPPKTIIPEYIELQSDQKEFYEELQNGCVAEADRVNIKTTSLLGLITRLRQATTCPEVLTSKKMTNAKIERACDLVDEIISNGEKVVIFSTFKDPLYRLDGELKKYKPLLCTGDQSDEFVAKAVEDFQTKDDNKVFLGTIQRVATGLTLTAASYMILLDSPWNASEFDQATDRIHRISAKDPVFIYNLIAKGTVDERVETLVNRKKGMSDFIIDDKYNQTEELKMLLGVNQEWK